MTYSTELQSQIDAALAAKGANYQPRTRHLQDDRPIYVNRLIFEDSPYLLQHAHNPVDWYAWGELAFAKAREQNKPIFLSIGYATCHWCHVMEEQSFENTDVADILNQHFISIKVDREQYPDIDQTYMSAVIMINGQGGWPMSSFLTTEGKPFFGGTYFTPGIFMDLLQKINTAWTDKQQELLDQAEHVAQSIVHANAAQEQITELGQSNFQAAVNAIMAQYDDKSGGFSEAPKFPNEPLLMLLLRALERQANKQVRAALDNTLSAMACGGLYDQVGGGFHRYSTDNLWLVPHFEKMLYNQAYLARIYTQAFAQTGNQDYARIAKQTLDYVLREMTTDSGVFYSATDADSEGSEGTYFVWSKAEIEQHLSSDDAKFIIDLYGVTESGNFEDHNILYLPTSLAEIATQQNSSYAVLQQRLEPLLETLRDYRQQRIPPLTDDKIIVAWNGMLITALVEAGSCLNEPRYITAATRAADELWTQQRPDQETLWRVNLDGKTSINARQDDYAHFAEALLALYDTTANNHYLEQAQSLIESMMQQFLDPNSGTLVMGRDKLLFAHPKDAYDGALPSGNAVAVRVLSKLANRTSQDQFRQQAIQILKAFSGSISQQPGAYAYMITQLDEMQFGESGSQQYAAGGAIKITHRLLKQEHGFDLNININIAEGWHLNSHIEQATESPLQIELRENSSWQLKAIEYPTATSKTLAFNQQEQSFFEGNIEIKSELSSTSETPILPILITLSLQACNHESCLAVETINLRLFETQS